MVEKISYISFLNNAAVFRVFCGPFVCRDITLETVSTLLGPE